MKNLKLLLLSLLTVGAFSYSATASANWYTPNCPNGQLKKQGSNRYQCETVTSRVPRCPQGSNKNVHPTGIDKCQRVANEQVQAPRCNLSVGQSQNNWRINIRNGADFCTHKTQPQRKGQKPLKCQGGGYALVRDKQGNRDQCVKSNGRAVSTPIRCNSGETHKKRGQDKCERVAITRPRI